MGLTPGTRLGAYQILSALGAGGMGEVYRARDGTLQRDVALKILPELFALNPDRLSRFRREAQLERGERQPRLAAALRSDPLRRDQLRPQLLLRRGIRGRAAGKPAAGQPAGLLGQLHERVGSPADHPGCRQADPQAARRGRSRPPGPRPECGTVDPRPPYPAKAKAGIVRAASPPGTAQQGDRGR